MADTDATTDGDGDGMSRRTLIRLLVALGIGLPILVEGLTFLGLVRNAFGGEDGDSGVPGVRPGDEFLPQTDREETLTAASLTESGGARELTLTVQVHNTAPEPYSLRLGALILEDGGSVDGDATTGRIPPGETDDVTARWSLPPEGRPRSVYVEWTTYGGDQAVTNSTQVRLAPLED
ncbi:MAG: hypothetical protein ABEJ70_03230 [Halobacteriaceae archaeon]